MTEFSWNISDKEKSIQCTNPHVLLFMTKAQYKSQTLLVLTELGESPQNQN